MHLFTNKLNVLLMIMSNKCNQHRILFVANPYLFVVCLFLWSDIFGFVLFAVVILIAAQRSKIMCMIMTAMNMNNRDYIVIMFSKFVLLLIYLYSVVRIKWTACAFTNLSDMHSKCANVIALLFERYNQKYHYICDQSLKNIWFCIDLFYTAEKIRFIGVNGNENDISICSVKAFCNVIILTYILRASIILKHKRCFLSNCGFTTTFVKFFA